MQIISNRYGGDARRIWDGQPISEILQRLEDATFGPNLSHMVVGALIDTKQIEGRGNLKADINVTRVLGRVFTGSKTTPDEVHRIAARWSQATVGFLTGASSDWGSMSANQRNRIVGVLPERQMCSHRRAEGIS